MEPVDLATLKSVFRALAGRVRYRLGAKAPSLSIGAPHITHLDCSGFVRYALSKATRGKLVIPDGSWNQREWAQENLRALARYSDVSYAEGDPSRLFIAFLPAKGKKPGHVWLVCGGETLESCGGRGVCSRPWDTPALLKAVDAFEVPTS